MDPSPSSPATQTAIRTVQAVINPAAGHVGADSKERLKLILDAFGIESHVVAPAPDGIENALAAAISAKPDLVVVLAGDGTAGRAAALCGPEGPLLAPLPGGTMNMLPHALYGPVDWGKALTASLQGGRERPVSCGEVGGLRFYCVAIVGSPAFWAPAREATRYGDLGRAWQHARIAFRRTFGARLKYQGDGRPRRTALALSLICPLISKALESENALEAAGLDLHDMGDVFRLGLHNMLGDWRRDPGVITETMTRGRVWSRRRVPCLIDGEMHWLARSADIGFVPTAFRALAPLEPPV